MRDRVKEQTTRAILEAAEVAFAEEGLHTARMEGIAARAGVAVGTVYNYFEDRAALVTALLASSRAMMLERLDAALAEGASSPWRAQLEGFLRAFLSHIEAHRAFFAILFEGSQVEVHKSASAMQAMHARFEALVARGVAAGDLEPEHEALYPSVLLGMCRGVMMRELKRNRGAELSSWAGTIAKLFVEGAGR